MPSVLWHCWFGLGMRKSNPAVTDEWGGAGTEWGANYSHVVQLMPLPPIISCFIKIQICLAFLVMLAYLGCLEKEAIKWCVRLSLSALHWNYAKLFQTLVIPAVLHSCECCMLSQSLCYKLNVFQTSCLRSKWQHLICHMTLSDQDTQSTRQWPNAWLWRLGWTGQVLRHNDLIVHKVMLSKVNTNLRGHHCCLISDMEEDICNACNFANMDKLHHQRLQWRQPSVHGTSQRSRPLQVSKVCQDVLIRKLVLKTSQQMPSAC